jgi:hypothetical protein
MAERYAAFDAKSNSKMDLADFEKVLRPLPIELAKIRGMAIGYPRSHEVSHRD